MPPYVSGPRLRTGKEKGKFYNKDIGWYLERKGRLAAELHSERNGAGNEAAGNLGNRLCLVHFSWQTSFCFLLSRSAFFCNKA